MAWSDVLRQNVNENQELFIAAGAFLGTDAIFFSAFTDSAVTTGQKLVWQLDEVYTYSSSATSWFISSTSASDTANTFTVVYLDGDYVKKAVTVTPNGQNQVLIATDCFRIFQVVNTSAAESQGNIYIAESDTLTAGVPNTVTKIRSFVEQGIEVSHIGAFTVPEGESWFLRTSVQSTGVGGGANNSCLTQFRIREPGRVFLSGAMAEVITGTVSSTDLIPLKLAEKTDIQITCEATLDGPSFLFNIGFITIRNERLPAIG